MSENDAREPGDIFWWLSILSLAGKWYAGSLDLEHASDEEQIGRPSSKMTANARLISLAYR